jgi:hypothetical protein
VHEHAPVCDDNETGSGTFKQQQKPTSGEYFVSTQTKYIKNSNSNLHMGNTIVTHATKSVIYDYSLDSETLQKIFFRLSKFVLVLPNSFFNFIKNAHMNRTLYIF